MAFPPPFRGSDPECNATARDCQQKISRLWPTPVSLPKMTRRQPGYPFEFHVISSPFQDSFRAPFRVIGEFGARWWADKAQIIGFRLFELYDGTRDSALGNVSPRRPE